MHPDALAGIPKFQANEIIYVSCNPSTLSRDAQYLISEDGGYKMTDVIPVDMFPHTHHIETIVRFEKK